MTLMEHTRISPAKVRSSRAPTPAALRTDLSDAEDNCKLLLDCAFPELLM
jgi:hypothetical protein